MSDAAGLPEPSLALDNQTCFALYAANRAMTALYRPVLAELGLTYPQYLVMLVLWEAEATDEPVRVSFVGERLRLDTGTLTPLLKRLEAQGLVQRQRDTADERVVNVSLTAAGASLRHKAKTVPARLLCGTGVDPQRLVRLREELKSLLGILDAGPSAE